MLSLTEHALLADRLLLSFIFLLAGATKLVDPLGLRKSWRDFGLPKVLAPLAVLVLPLAELAVGLALIPARVAWYGAWGALGLLAAFLAVVGIAMVRGRKPDCRCFGQLHSAPVGRSTLIRDGLLAAAAGWLVWGGRVGPGLWAWFTALTVDEKKFAVIAACVAGFLFFRLLDRSRPRSQAVEVEEATEDEEATEEPVVRPKRVARVERPAPLVEATPAGPGAQGIGLPIGTPAPDFALPSLAGETRSLQGLREQGKDILLVFSSPFCEPCNALAPKLVRWAREMDSSLQIVLISRGTAQDNFRKLKGFEPSRVLLQREFEISEAYDCTATPTAVLVGADGLIRSGLATGREAIQELVSGCARRASERLVGSEPGQSGPAV